MLDKKEINKNKKIFEKTNEMYNVFTPKLVEFLGENLFNSPASPLLSQHNACTGGLMDHMIKIAKYAAMFNEILPENLRSTKESVLKVSFLCEIGKVFLFTPCESKWHRDNQGKMYDYVENLVAMKVGERSIFYALSNGIFLTEEECQAILSIDKDDDDKMIKWHSSPLAKILKTAIEFAIMEEKNDINE